MPYYFMRDTPLQALEQLMMSQPGQKSRGGGIYAGNALLQKRYTPDMLSRQQKTNHGEREMYFVPESNDAIISPEIFERAQVLRQKRSLGKAPVHSEIISQIRCICGARMRFKNVNSKRYLSQAHR